MSTIFPTLDSNLNLSTSIDAPAAIRAINATKLEFISKLLEIGIGIGKHIQAEVLAKLDNGNVLAKIGGIAVRLQMPAGVQVGQQISLTLTQLSPKPTFSIDRSIRSQPSSVNPGNNTPLVIEEIYGELTGTNELNNQDLKQLLLNSTQNTLASLPQSRVNTLNSHISQELVHAYTHPVDSPLPSTEIELSPTAVLINNLLAETPESINKLQMTGKTPILEAVIPKAFNPETAVSEVLETTISETTITPTKPKEIVFKIEQQLKKEISASGLFYEAHVSQWLSGTKTLNEIKLEPQANLPLLIETNLLANVINKPEEESRKQLTQLIHQQLTVLEQKEINWTGKLTEQIAIQWQINKQEERSNTSKNEPIEVKENWTSQLNLDLPHLGMVSIQIQLHDNKINLALKSQQDVSITKFQNNFSNLEQAMKNAGIKIESFTAKLDEPD